MQKESRDRVLQYQALRGKLIKTGIPHNKIDNVDWIKNNLIKFCSKKQEEEILNEFKNLNT